MLAEVADVIRVQLENPFDGKLGHDGLYAVWEMFGTHGLPWILRSWRL
jgi:hypothetical protein